LTSSKDIGAYYTPPKIIKEILPWVMQGVGSDMHILEPSCGEGRFLSALDPYRKRIASVDAIELIPLEAKKAATALSVSGKVHTADFFDWLLRTHLTETPFGNRIREEMYDVVIGNPPYVSFRKQSDCQKQCVSQVMDAYQVDFNKHSSIWLPFMVSSLLSLKQGGRLGMVIPSEILTVKYAQAIRDLLIDECSEVRILDLPGVWFESTQQACVVLLAIRDSNIPCRVGLHKSFHHQGMTFVHGPLLKGSKWTSLLLGEEVRTLLDGIFERPHVHRLGDVSTVLTSFTTGCDSFFFLSREDVDRRGLSDYVVPLVPKCSEFAGLSFGESTHLHLSKQGSKCWCVSFQDDYENLSPEAQSYIDYGLSIKADSSYKSNARRVWYQLGDLPRSPLCLYRRSDITPRMVLNPMGAVVARTAYHVTPQGSLSPESLLVGFSNPLTWLCAELEGRSFGGGLLELSSNEMKDLPVILSDHNTSLYSTLEKGDVRQVGGDLMSDAGLTVDQQRMLLRAYQALLNRRRNSQLTR